jgi:hypothetical protein
MKAAKIEASNAEVDSKDHAAITISHSIENDDENEEKIFLNEEKDEKHIHLTTTSNVNDGILKSEEKEYSIKSSSRNKEFKEVSFK